MTTIAFLLNSEIDFSPKKYWLEFLSMLSAHSIRSLIVLPEGSSFADELVEMGLTPVFFPLHSSFVSLAHNEHLAEDLARFLNFLEVAATVILGPHTWLTYAAVKLAQIPALIECPENFIDARQTAVYSEHFGNGTLFVPTLWHQENFSKKLAHLYDTPIVLSPPVFITNNLPKSAETTLSVLVIYDCLEGHTFISDIIRRCSDAKFSDIIKWTYFDSSQSFHKPIYQAEPFSGDFTEEDSLPDIAIIAGNSRISVQLCMALALQKVSIITTTSFGTSACFLSKTKNLVSSSQEAANILLSLTDDMQNNLHHDSINILSELAEKYSLDQVCKYWKEALETLIEQTNFKSNKLGLSSRSLTQSLELTCKQTDFCLNISWKDVSKLSLSEFDFDIIKIDSNPFKAYLMCNQTNISCISLIFILRKLKTCICNLDSAKIKLVFKSTLNPQYELRSLEVPINNLLTLDWTDIAFDTFEDFSGEKIILELGIENMDEEQLEVKVLVRKGEVDTIDHPILIANCS